MKVVQADARGATLSVNQDLDIYYFNHRCFSTVIRPRT